MRYGYHLHHVLVTDCLKANQGKKSHKDVEATIKHHLNTYTSITATQAKPFSDGKQADILLSGITTIDNPAARNWHLDVTSTNPMGVTNQELINRAGLNHQPGLEEHDPRNDVLTSAKRAEERKHTKYDAICAATGSVLYLSRSKRRAGTVPPRVGVLALHVVPGSRTSYNIQKANARLGSAGGRAAGIASSRRTSRLRYAGARSIAQVTTHHHALEGFAATPGQRALVRRG